MQTSQLILDPALYQDQSLQSLWEVLAHRVQLQPINLLFLILFVLAIIHTFFAHRFHRMSLQENMGLEESSNKSANGKRRSFTDEMLAFIGEVEVVFGLWCIPLFIAIAWTYNWQTVLNYLSLDDYSESLFLVVAMAVASTYPIIRFFEKGLGSIASLGGRTHLAWWLSIMTIGPLLGSFIKETVAMTISAVLLGTYFYRFHPPKKFAYATLGLLFVNVSVGGMLTTFGNFSVSVVVKPWGWDSLYMFTHFGWKALIGILLSNTLYCYYFWDEFEKLDSQPIEEKIDRKEIPYWITIVHLSVLTWLIINNQNPVIALGSFVLFLGFYQATTEHQTFMSLRGPIMVGFFLASLIIFCGLQIWWLQPIFQRMNEWTAMEASLLLSAFTHNAVTNYLATKIPNLSEEMKYAIFSGTMAGGGLTLMANGPNLVAYSLLSKYFPGEISIRKLFLAALLPTIIMAVCFALLP